MRAVLLLLFFQCVIFSQAQIHNRLIKFNIGISSEQIDQKNDINNFNDTSLHQFEFVSAAPTFSYSHEFTMGNILSLSGKVGFQYLNIFYDQKHYGSPFVYASINPALTLINRGNFEYYVKLQVGLNYWFNKPDVLSDITRRLFPEKLNVFTGVTIGGFNYYINDSYGLNLEISLWSPEFVSFGVSYRFLKGAIPSIQEMHNY